MSKRKPLWASGINMFGLWYTEPTKVYWDAETKNYWDKEENMCARGIGERRGEYGGYITFASFNKKDVEHWIMGVRAVYANLIKMAHQESNNDR